MLHVVMVGMGCRLSVLICTYCKGTIEESENISSKVMYKVLADNRTDSVSFLLSHLHHRVSVLQQQPLINPCNTSDTVK